MSELSLLRRLLLACWYLLTGLVVLGAVLLSIARVVLPMMDEYRLQLQTWASSTIGYPVEVGKLDIAWRGWGPELRLEDFTLRDATGETLLNAEKVGLGINLLRTALAGELRLSLASIVGTHLSLVRLESGRIVLEGFEDITPAAHPLTTFLAQPRFAIKRSSLRWQDRRAGGRAWDFGQINFRLTNRGERHRLDFSADLPPLLGRQFDLAADLQGPGVDLTRWHGQVYVQGRELRLRHWLRESLPAGVRADARLDVELWMGLRNGLVRTAGAALDMHDLELWSGQDEVEPFSLAHLGGFLRWQQESTGWRLDVDQLRVEFPGRAWPTSGISLRWGSTDDSGYRFRTAIDYLNIGDALQLAENLPFVPIPQPALLRGLHPRGELRDLQFGFQKRADGPGLVLLEADFKNLATNSYASWPGVAGLSGHIAGANDRGQIRLRGSAVSVRAPERFRRPLRFGYIRGEANWQRHGNLLRIVIPQLHQKNTHIETRARIRLDIPGEGTGPYVDASVAVLGGNLRAAKHYLPTEIMPAAAVRWLDAAFVSGRIDSGALLLHGPLARFPFHGREGRFEARVNVADAILDYRPGWPRIEELDAEASFVNLGMSVRAAYGKILETELTEADAVIDDLTHATLEIDGGASGSLAGMLRFVEESPLGVNFKPTLAALQAEGPADLALTLSVPLPAKGRRIGVQGEVTLPGNRLAMPKWDLALEALHGQLNFDEAGLFTPSLDLELFGKPALMAISHQREGKAAATQVRVTGELPIMRHYRIPELLPFAGISGEAAWDIVLTIPRRDQPGDLAGEIVLNSDLAGVAVDLPKPYGKRPAEKRSFTLRTGLTEAPQRVLDFAYGGVLSGLVEIDLAGEAPGFRRGAISLGEGPAKLPDKTGLIITGRARQLRVADWREWWSGMSMRSARGTSPAAGNAALLRQLDVQVDDLEAFNRHFSDLKFGGGRDDKAWVLSVRSPAVTGVGRIPFAVTVDQPLQFNFEQVQIPAATQPTQAPEVSIDPASIPPLALTIKALKFGDLALGQAGMRLLPVVGGVRVDSLQLATGWMNLQASGAWTRVNHEESSHFLVEIRGDDFGDMLEELGYSAEMKGGKAEIKIDATWPAAPYAVTFENLHGELDLKVGAGRLVEVEPGAGRLFGLLSLNSLQRRLSLDFSDLFRKGYTFDRIEGQFTLDNANAYTDNLYIDGPSARVEINGRVGLAARDYDQLVTVVPNVSSTLPIAGAIAGGPAVGAALLLADKLLPRQMEMLTSFSRYRYSLTGSWENPQLTRLSAHKGRSDDNRPNIFSTEEDG